MTKRKLLRAGFLLQALLIMATAYGDNLKQMPSSIAVLAAKTPVYPELPARKDTGIVQVPDSAVIALTEKVLVAPRVPLNPNAVVYLKHYVKKNEKVLQGVEKRSEPVFKIIDGIFQKHNLPVELRYLAVIESDLIRTAVSRVGAAGPWQLMPGTARDLGLKVNKKVDERKNFTKSTQAAALYLKDLYRIYGDWLLVIAAYNSGPGPVNKAIRRSGSRNFWKLQYYLPAETRNHVKRYISTHYYFENEGSITTLTRAEVAAYKKEMAKYIELRSSLKEEARAVAAAIQKASLDAGTDSSKLVAKEK